MSLTEKQKAVRRTGVTATDMRVLAGVDPYGRTPHDVWSTKVLGVDDFKETEATELGQELEPILVPRLARKVGLHALRVDPESLTMRHPQVAHHLATPDALFAPSAFHKAEAIGQVKVCGLRAAAAWGEPEDGPGAVPDHVLVQCAWELYVSRHVVEHVGALCGTELRVYRLELSPDVAHLIEALCEVADRFWTDHVVARKPPPLDGTEGATRMLQSLYPVPRGPAVRASAELEAQIGRYFALQAESKAAEQVLKTAKQELISVCGDSEAILGEGWRLLYAMQKGYVVKNEYEVPAMRKFDLRKVGEQKPGPGPAKTAPAAKARRNGKAA